MLAPWIYIQCFCCWRGNSVGKPQSVVHPLAGRVLKLVRLDMPWQHTTGLFYPVPVLPALHHGGLHPSIHTRFSPYPTSMVLPSSALVSTQRCPWNYGGWEGARLLGCLAIICEVLTTLSCHCQMLHPDKFHENCTCVVSLLLSNDACLLEGTWGM